jgi:RNA polymerase sigma-70 factor (ECF subfamily)
VALLGGLPPGQRAALTLRYVFDLDDRTIARAIGCRPTTVRSHLFYGRAALRARLLQEGDHPS